MIRTDEDAQQIIRRLTALFKVHEQHGVTDCFKDMAFSVLVGLHADFASLSAEILRHACTTFEIQINERTRTRNLI
jgi:hypothetical protein